MRGILPLLGVCVLLLSAQIEAKKNKNQRNFWDIWSTDKEKTHPAAGDDFTLEDVEGSGTDDEVLIDNDGSNVHEDDEDFDDIGSGDDRDSGIDIGDDYYDEDDDVTQPPDTDDEDDEDLVGGSGSGDSEPEEPPVTRVTTEETVINGTTVDVTTERTPLTACQQLRATSLGVSSFGGIPYVPECDDEGEYKKQQCKNEKLHKYCWCVDPHGKIIKGTKLKHPTTPDCEFGTNLTTCVFQLVQNSQGLLGAYKPKCTELGDYEPTQCQGSECWCVDRLGNEIPASMRAVPEMPDCTMTTKAPSTQKPVKTTKLPPGYVIPVDTNVIVNIDETVITIDSSEIEQEEEATNEINNNNSVFSEPQEQETRLLASPGLLAAVIGGAVVGLLCMVLLVMFIVYRMRKKDEGSYPLEEQKYQNYSYAKAPDKEFYA